MFVAACLLVGGACALFNEVMETHVIPHREFANHKVVPVTLTVAQVGGEPTEVVAALTEAEAHVLVNGADEATQDELMNRSLQRKRYKRRREAACS